MPPRSLDLSRFRLLALGILGLSGCASNHPEKSAPETVAISHQSTVLDFDPMSVGLTDVVGSKPRMSPEALQQSFEAIELKESELRRVRTLMAAMQYQSGVDPELITHFLQEKAELEIGLRRLMFEVFYMAGTKVTFDQLHFPATEDMDYFRRIVVCLAEDPGKLNGYIAEKISELEQRLTHLRSMLYLSDVDAELDSVAQQIRREQIIDQLARSEDFLQSVHLEFHRGMQRK